MIKDLENAIGYSFNNKELLENAITHSSYNMGKAAPVKDNERLEFLGDAFFDAIISEKLFKDVEDFHEGKLSKTRASVVCENSLAKIARELDLGKYIKLGHGEKVAGGNKKESILADTMEAIIGAIYLDGGYNSAKEFVLKFFEAQIEEALSGKLFSDYKSELQERIQEGGTKQILRYATTKEEGPEHDKTFYVDVILEGNVIGSGIGKSKKKAEQQAAREALKSI